MSQAGIISVSNAVPGTLDQISGNTGTASPDANHNINLVTANTTVKFVAAGSTITQDFGGTNLLLGDNGASIAGATQNVGLGQLALHSLSSGSLNTVLGNGAGTNINSGQSNTLVGADAGAGITTGINNTAIGETSLSTSNGSNNIALGVGAGSNAGPTTSSNIWIGNNGSANDQNVIRLGTQGSGAGQQSQTFIAGVINTVSGRVVKTTTPGAYPYTTLTTDYVILASSTAAHTINLIAAPVTGTTYRIKDVTGSASINNITITPAAGNIDGGTSLVLNTNFASVDLVYNGTAWNVF